MAIVSANVRFSIDFHISTNPPTLDFTDLQLGYSSKPTTQGLIWIVDPAATTIYKNSGYDLDNFASPDVDGGTPDWVQDDIKLTQGSDLLPVTGVWTFNYKVTDDAGVTVYTITKTYTYNVSAVTTAITNSLSCDDSQLTFTDATDYEITDYNSTAFSPTTTTRSWVLGTTATTYSQGTIAIGNLATYTIGFSTGYNNGSVLYTGNYTSTLTVSTVYTLDTWGGTDWFFLNDTMTDTSSNNVQCNICTCTFYDCLASIFTRYLGVINGTLSGNIQYYKDAMSRAAYYLTMYNAAQACGEDTGDWCTRIKDLIDSDSDCCDTTEDTINTAIVPITVSAYSISSASTASAITFGTAAAGLPSSPSRGDMHLFTSTGGAYDQWDVYWYDGVGWVDQGNILGADGASGSSTIPVLHNDISNDADANNTFEQFLKSYSLPQATLAPNDSYLEIVAYINIDANINTTLRLRFDSQIILEHAINTSIETNVILRALAHRDSSTTLICEPFFTVLGLPDATESMTWTTPTVGNLDSGGVLDIEVSSEKAVSLGLSDLIVRYLRVERHIKTT